MLEAISRSPLLRGNYTQVSNFLSSFGRIKETNLSAMIGYLIHLNPRIAEDLFKIQLPVQVVSLESSGAGHGNRFDIIIENSKKQYLIEVKIGTHSPEQLHKYRKNSPDIITIGSRLQSHLVNRQLHSRFFDWNQVADCLLKCKIKGRNANHFFNALVDDFIFHLKENNMIRGSLKDVYLRDLSGDSVEWYFNQRIYTGQAKFFDGARNARYFAPYLTGSNNKESGLSVFRALGIGISFVSKIESSALISPKELYSVLIKRKWTRREIQEFYAGNKWRVGSNKDQAVLFLEKPMRLFQRPVTKYDLWGIAGGAMPSMTVDFGDLVAAANGLYPLKSKQSRIKKK